MLFFSVLGNLSFPLSFDPFSSFLFFFFWPHQTARGILVPHLGVKLRPQAGIKSAES